MAEVVIPAKLAAIVVDWEGDSGRAWLAQLPGLIGEVAGAWDLELDDPFEPGGNISWVAPARRRGDGAALALAAWHGAGAVRLLAHDRDRRALLVERGRALAALIAPHLP